MEYEPKNILVRGVNWLGDSLVTIPALRTLRKIYPESRITLLIKEPLDELFPPFTAIDRVIGFSVRRGAGGLIDRLRLAGQLRRERFDLCVILPNSFDSALVPFLAGIPQRIGFSRDGRGMLLTKRVPPVPLGTGEHQAKDYLKLVTSLKQEATVMDFHLEVAEEAREWADETLSVFRKSAPNALIGFNPGAAYGPAKMWFPDRFTELGTRLWNGIGAGIVLVGGPGERELCRSIARKISGEVLDLSGRTSLPQLAAVLSLCDLVVTNDSGPMHLASAVGTPVIAIFGSTNPDATSPLGPHEALQEKVDCSPCLERICPRGDMQCMERIRVSDVLEAVIRLLPDTGEPARV
jgi:heptosyltransferase-2